MTKFRKSFLLVSILAVATTASAFISGACGTSQQQANYAFVQQYLTKDDKGENKYYNEATKTLDLSEVNISEIPDGALSINALKYLTGTNSFYDVDKKQIVIDKLILGKDVKKIGNAAFWNSGIKSIEFKDNNVLEFIGDSAFAGNNLTTFTMPNSVKYIGKYSFSNNEQLKSITLSSSLETISAGAFQNDALTTINFANVKNVNSYALAKNNFSNVLIIPATVKSLLLNTFDYPAPRGTIYPENKKVRVDIKDIDLKNSLKEQLKENPNHNMIIVD